MPDEILEAHLFFAQTSDPTLLEWWIANLPDADYCYVENEVEVTLNWLTDFEVTRYPVGRVFGPHYELRWQRLDSTAYEVQILTETDLPFDGFERLPASFEAVPTTVRLWGILARYHPAFRGEERIMWIETRIPRSLTYPVTPDSSPSQQWVKVNALEYRDNGIIRATRWQTLEATHDYI